jgi:hypothetical protein
MFIGCLISAAFLSAAAVILRASASVTTDFLPKEEKCKRHSKSVLHVLRFPDNNIESMDTACEGLHFDDLSLFRRSR